VGTDGEKGGNKGLEISKRLENYYSEDVCAKNME